MIRPPLITRLQADRPHEPLRLHGARSEQPHLPQPEPAAARSMLLVFTRDPRGRMTGRKMVLNTIVRSLQQLGHCVTVAHFGAPVGPPVEDGIEYVALPSPGIAERLGNTCRWLLNGSISLNEALYHGRRVDRLLRDLARAKGAELIVTDMLRTAGYGARSNLPWIADLDDLLSRRYGQMAADDEGTTNLLGYHDAPLMRGLGKLVSFALPWVLRREARIIAAREVGVARAAHVVSLVSSFEASMLAQEAGRPVATTPMAVPGPAVVPEGPRPRELVFLGGFDYELNRRTARRFDADVRPELQGCGLTDVRLHVIGYADAAQRAGFSDAIVFEGYVPNLDAALRDYKAMIVPEVLPGGVKTKMINAALNGVIVLCHVSAIEGMNVEPGRHVLVWDSPHSLAEHIRALRVGALDAAAIVANAHAWAVANFGEAILRKRWEAHVAKAFAAPSGS